MKIEKHKTMTPTEFGDAFGISRGAVSMMIREGRLRGFNRGNGKVKASWLIPIGEFERYKAAGYRPRKQMPIVVDPVNVPLPKNTISKVRRTTTTPTLPFAERNETDRQIQYHAAELARLIDERLGELADLSDLAEKARALLDR